MLFWKRNFNTIVVEFIDAATGAVFARSKLPVDQLPESFEAATTFELNDESWSVIQARPMTSAEFRRTGKLTLVVQKLEQVRLDELLYSLPTISNELPSDMVGSKLEKNVLEIHEDDWRQIEFISRQVREAIDGEIEAIQSIFDTQRAGMGFRNVHVRRGLPAPVEPGIPVDDLKDGLGRSATWLKGIAFHGVAGILADSFAVRSLSSFELYGICSAGNIVVLGLHNARLNNLGACDLPALAGFAAQHDLCLVDWCRRAVIDPDDGQFREYFQS